MSTDRIFLEIAGTYKPGDLPPEGYLQWHEWAEVQHKAGLKQAAACHYCGLWQFPQELSGKSVECSGKTGRGKVIRWQSVICTKCARARLLTLSPVAVAVFLRWFIRECLELLLRPLYVRWRREARDGNHPLSLRRRRSFDRVLNACDSTPFCIEVDVCGLWILDEPSTDDVGEDWP